MSKRKLPEGWEGDPPEHETETWNERDSRDARAAYFLATRPSQIFIHYVAKDLRDKVKADPSLPQLIKDIDAKTLSRMRKTSVLNVQNSWNERGIWNKSWNDGFFKSALKGLAIYPLATNSADEWKPAKGSRRKASRPLEMFLAQLKHELSLNSHDGSGVHEQKNISTIICNRIKRQWKAWGIWEDEWGDLPGLKWRHQYNLWGFLKETNWVRQIDLIPVPEGIGPSRESFNRTVCGPEDHIQCLLEQEETYQYAKKILEERQQRTGERELRKDWNDPDLSQRYHEWTYAGEPSYRAADDIKDWNFHPDVE
ncbi:hypothetical protein F5Y18DRAFT_432872 [Xylariaceae sp. FL1019]|nr:hypothetical protein F5Y18DRAFT_432872 [Xylariaceae sp. FL1019]